MPALTRVIRDTQFARQSQLDLGSMAIQLGQLRKWQLSTPPTILIPTFCFDQLLVQSRSLRKIQEKLNRIHQLPIDRRRSEVQQLITSIPISKEFIASIKLEYQQYLGAANVIITPSNPSLGSGIDQVRGDVSIIIGLQQIWAEMVIQALTQPQIVTKQKLAPSAVLIQQQQPTVWHGSIYNRHPDAMHKSALVVEVHQANETRRSQARALFQIDRRTTTIIARPASLKSHTASPVGHATTIDTTLLKKIATEAQSGFRHSFQSLRLNWAYDGTNLQWTGYSLDPIFPQKPITRPVQKLATRILLAVTSVHRGAAALSEADGVGLLDSNFLVNAVGMHPVAALQQSAARESLVRNITTAITDLTNASESKANRLIAYRLYNSPTLERRRLKLALNYESFGQEQAQLSSRAAFFLQHPSWLNFELETLHNAFTHNPGLRAIIIPGITSPKELNATLTILKRSEVFKIHRPQVWLEVSIPAVACNISLFDLDAIQTISFHHTAILQHMLDQPSSVSFKQHELVRPTSLRLFDIVENQLAQLTGAERPQLVLHSAIPDAHLVQHIVERGWYGISVSPAATLSTRAFVVDAERALLFRKIQTS